MKKIILTLVFIILAFGSWVAYQYYNKIYSPIVLQDFELYIPTNTSINTVVDSLQNHKVLKSVEDFLWLANFKKYTPKPGRYLLKKNMTNNNLVNKLRSGNQDAIKVTLHDIAGLYHLCGKLGSYFEADSLTFLDYLSQEKVLGEMKLQKHTIASVFLPDTYEFYWDASPETVLKKMKSAYDRFWDNMRLKKAESMGLTPLEVITLASIVEKETIKNDEKPKVAGLYYNRIQKKMLLQSDPTVIYAIQLEFPRRKITRVLFKDLKYDSPYNTYKYPGLPPGPIKIPAYSSIDAVLNYQKHDYIFMVADPDRPGYHSFAKTLSEHGINRKKYIRWISKQ